ncbi:MAG: hypothetical protein IPQ16_04615 [Geobacteraceae bacterium]|nr:hypothetical protein [Geobacteraceae bacterium]
MSEPVQFWLDNKMSAGIKVAAIADQTLVVYREKYYVVEKDAAQARGGKALRYSMTSLPGIWKKALKGEAPSADGLVVPPDDALPTPTTTKRERPKKERSQPAPPATVDPVQPQPVKAAPLSRSLQKMTMKPVAQTTVSANCPECNFRHEFPLEKGKNGKPFFTACTRCKADFAVRFVPATVFQAQVAGFR